MAWRRALGRGFRQRPEMTVPNETTAPDKSTVLDEVSVFDVSTRGNGFMTEETQSRRRYQMAGLDRQGVMLGLTWPQLLLLVVGLTATVLLFTAAAPFGLAIIPLAVGALFAKARWRGVLLVDWVRPLHHGFRSRRRIDWSTAQPWNGQDGETPWVLEGVTVTEESWSGLDRMAVVWDGTDDTAAMMFRVPGADFTLRDIEEREALLDGWGIALSAHAMEGTPVARICWTEIANRTSLQDHTTWVRQQGTNVRAPIRREYETLVRTAGPETTSHDVIVAVVVSARKLRASKWGSTGKTEHDRLLDALRRSAHTLMRGLQAAGLANGDILGVDEVAELMRQGADPTTAMALAPQLGDLSSQLGLSGQDRLGPLETWWNPEWFETDRCAHRTFWVQDWPRQPVAGPWLTELLSVPDSARRFTVQFTPVPPSSSHRRIDQELTRLDTDELAREDAGQRITAGHRRARDAVQAREEELVAGFAEVAYCAVVTVSATSMEGLELATAEFESSAVQSGLVLRPLDFQHDVGWAASLPIGLGVRAPISGLA